MTENIRPTFGSKIGVVLATVGSAVGLGNIWRFPYMLGENGGAAFLLVYIICILGLGLPVMITEFFIGRHTHRNAAGAFKALAPGSKWSLIGYNGVLAAFLILGFYSVVSGWTLEYLTQAATGSLSGKSAAEFAEDFSLFSSGIFRPIFWTALFIAITHIVIVSGVKKGIERASKIMMPLLFLILVVLCVRSVTLDGAEKGLSFLFNPHFDKIDSSVILSGMGQAFFSLSIGMGCLITYSSYFSKTTDLQRTALEVTILDTLVALLAGIMIFPAVFSFGIEPTAGPELVFITLPNVFEQLPWGSVWSFIFYILLVLAALTSTISLHEVATAYVLEEHKLSRGKAALLVSLGVLILGVVSSLSMGVWKEYTIFGLTFFNFLDYLTAKIMLPFGGMLICIFVGRRVDTKILKAELTNEGSISFHFFNTYAFFMKYVAPVAIALIFLHELGIIRWVKGLAGG
ncbi:NSS family neurotransmitter:Na+ symporter [Parabacteroides sp. PF5-5]|uniref:sodium-dependent transporter n=1 Tax=unclassified Parabacteroides TaxID=2649774 RepID=UPI002473D159|nr:MULTISPECIES: sodium-dependent transporter [unclassified Parabacteroides]MDH6303490.1 NSS family neurotransmitter:Na+ symporter [Parabacteroides sp. PH5-39]MDH6314812.1 NSS family neurotransmitter:Na+ symporter [Parabacteroides sp. PF5-13]MDH6318149.1 NSS family neurotransmitter:Na+ symporter [Parabacteroides sp. PH5-13]MDH6321919.1 NSS family neurotransmitter:Na+ symporter [Parabacteroides sp. PH5-8]MDH6326043.1 NSS family neurotransmitter:Na+ symporter [Parabacteroides sp. PH5-41]